MRRYAASDALPPPPTVRKRGSDWRVLKTLLPYLWEFRWRVALALAFMLAAKLANVSVPLVLKGIVDSLTAENAVLVVPMALLVDRKSVV